MTPQQARETAEKIVSEWRYSIPNGSPPGPMAMDELTDRITVAITSTPQPVAGDEETAENVEHTVVHHSSTRARRAVILQALTAARADERRKFIERGLADVDGNIREAAYGVATHPGGWPVGEPTRWVIVDVARSFVWTDEGGRWFFDEHVFDRPEDAAKWIEGVREAESAALAARRKESGE